MKRLLPYPVIRAVHLVAVAALSLFIAAPYTLPAQEFVADDSFDNPATFRVLPDVVNRDLEPFTATIGSIGNAITYSGFEPAIARTRIFATGDSPNTILASESDLAGYDVLREGFWDGGEARIYRITGGKFRMVREARIPEGGTRMSDWRGAVGDNKLVAPDQTRFEYRFDGFNRKDVNYYFTVAAVKADGTESEKAEAVEVYRSQSETSGEADPGRIVDFKVPGDAQPSDPPAAPGNLRGEYDAERGVAVLRWDASATGDIAGYRVYRSDYAPDQHKGYGIDLEGEGEALKKGDLIFLNKKFTSFSRNRYHSNRVWGSRQNKEAMPTNVGFYPDEDPDKTWELEPHPDDTPVEEPGETSIKISLKEGAQHRFADYNHSGTKGNWYEVLRPNEPYVVEFWAKQEGMTTPVVTFKLNGFYSQDVEPVNFEISGDWQKYEATFQVNSLYESEGGVGQTDLSFKGPGTIWLDNYRVYRASADFGDYEDYEYESLEESAMATLRTHAFIKTGRSTYDMDQFTNPAGVVTNIGKGNTLPQSLEVMKKGKVHPWLQIEMHMSPEEWLGFVEFIAAPYDPATDTPESKPWAHKRYEQGQEKPWVDEFERIYFEISNETWNWLFHPWVFEGMSDEETGETYNRGKVYGFFQEYVIDLLKSSPYWESSGLEEKMKFVLGGWRPQTYGLQAATGSPRSDYITRAGYNGGWDEGEGPAEGNDPSLFRAMIFPGWTGIPNAREFYTNHLEIENDMGADFALGTYEAGPGYALSGLNNQARMTDEQVRAQEETMKSLGAGTATLDTFLGRAYYDFDIQNFFTFYHGKTHWVSHTAWHKGPIAYPCWMTLALFNREGTGDLLAVVPFEVPSIDLPEFKRRKAAPDVPLVSCYATREGDRVNLFLLSSKVDNFPQAGNDGHTPVTVELPFPSAGKVTLHRMAGDPRLHNIDSEEVTIEKVELPASVVQSGQFTVNVDSGGAEGGLPPGATFLYVFEGVEMPEGKDISPLEVQM